MSVCCWNFMEIDSLENVCFIKQDKMFQYSEGSYTFLLSRWVDKLFNFIPFRIPFKHNKHCSLINLSFYSCFNLFFTQMFVQHLLWLNVRWPWPPVQIDPVMYLTGWVVQPASVYRALQTSFPFRNMPCPGHCCCLSVSLAPQTLCCRNRVWIGVTSQRPI